METYLIILALVVVSFLWYFKRQNNYKKGVVNYKIAELKEKLKNDSNTILLDVRTSMERKSKMINGSIHIPIHDLKHSFEILRKHINKEIIFYCHSGVRSLRAAHILKQQGFNSANLKGGIVAWLAFEKNE